MQRLKVFCLAAFLSGCVVSGVPGSKPNPASPVPSPSASLAIPSPTPILDPLKVTTITYDTQHPDLPKILIPGLKLEVMAGSGKPGFKDGKGIDAQFHYPRSIVSDGQGNCYIADTLNHRIRKMSADGQVTTLAGSSQGIQGGDFAQAHFSEPYTVWMDSPDLLYVLDYSSMIYALHLDTRQVELLVYSQKRFPQSKFFSQTIAQSTLYAYPDDYTDFAYRDGYFYVGDPDKHNLKRFNLKGEISQIVGFPHNGQDEFWLEEFPVAKDGPPDKAVFRFPYNLLFDKQGNLLLNDGGQMVRKVDAHTQNVTTLIGKAIGTGITLRLGVFDGGIDEADFAALQSLALHPDQSMIYLADGTVRVFTQQRLYTLIRNINAISVSISQDTLYISDNKYDRIYKMSLESITPAALAQLKQN